MAEPQKHRGNLYTYSGKIAFPGGAPSLMDIAISLSREGRYVGQGMRFWPVALHTFVVCDMLPPYLKLHGLLHDSSECITGDVPKPVKTDAIEAFEVEVLTAIYKSLGLTMPTEEEHKLVKVEDRKALRGEVYTVGTQSLQEINERCPEAEVLIRKYIGMYTYTDCLEASGKVPIDFMCRFREYKDLQKELKCKDAPITKLL
jgi:5'-deoxynucleotidase YfbR-like HD superfamily hydrolase